MGYVAESLGKVSLYLCGRSAFIFWHIYMLEDEGTAFPWNVKFRLPNDSLTSQSVDFLFLWYFCFRMFPAVLVSHSVSVHFCCVYQYGVLNINSKFSEICQLYIMSLVNFPTLRFPLSNFCLMPSYCCGRNCVNFFRLLLTVLTEEGRGGVCL